MGEVVAFRAKRLSGFLPDDGGVPVNGVLSVAIDGAPPVLLPVIAGRLSVDTSPSESNPDSGDCA